MPQFAHLPLFILASLVLLITPGPAVLYIIARSIDQGRAAGLLSVLSIETGNFFHALLAALGISALVLSSPLLFSIIKYLGAAYLVYLGIRKLIARVDTLLPVQVERQENRRIFSQGVTVAILNPKTALFFLAFLPQFVDIQQGKVPLQMFTLGCSFVLLAFITDSIYALLAGTAGGWLRSSARFQKGLKYVSACIYVGLGLVAAVGL